MQTLYSLQLAVLMTLGLAVVGGAIRCQVTHPPAEIGGAFTTHYETCDPGLNFCFRGRLTGAGERAIFRYFDWPVKRGQVLRACVESLEPPMDEMWDWYQRSSIRVCNRDGCNGN